jgi:hypothetical protein
MKTLKEQIICQCVHFTGIMDKVCRAGINYDTFPQPRIDTIPCLNGGSGECEKQEFLTEEQADQKVNEILNDGNVAIKLLIAAKEHYNKTGLAAGEFNCPGCGEKAQYVRAQFNGHFSVSCKKCGQNLRE